MVAASATTEESSHLPRWPVLGTDLIGGTFSGGFTLPGQLRSQYGQPAHTAHQRTRHNGLQRLTEAVSKQLAKQVCLR